MCFGYEAYRQVTGVVVVGSCGDTLDRCLVRLLEVTGSAIMVVEGCFFLGSTVSSGLMHASDMEHTIVAFKFSHVGTGGAHGHSTIECPKGVMVVWVVVCSGALWRCRCRCPDLIHL